MTATTAPIAWMVYTLDGKSAFVTDNPADFTQDHQALPLYTTPPQRQPLTDDEICKLWDSHTIEVFGKIGINPVVFARYLEREYGIGEKE